MKEIESMLKETIQKVQNLNSSIKALEIELNDEKNEYHLNNDETYDVLGEYVDNKIIFYTENILDAYNKNYKDKITLNNFYKTLLYHELGHSLDTEYESNKEAILDLLNYDEVSANEERIQEKFRTENFAYKEGLNILKNTENDEELTKFYVEFNEEILNIYGRPYDPTVREKEIDELFKKAF